MVIRRRQRRATAAARATEARYRRLQAFLQDARTFHGVEAETVPGLRMRAGADELVYLCIRGIYLFETQLDLTEPEGVRQRRAPTPVDQGELAVTDRRAVFTGVKQIRQWSWPSSIGISHAERGPWTTIDVSNRRRQFGVLYDDENREQIRFSIDLAVANATGARDELVRHIESELDTVVSAAADLGIVEEAAPHPDVEEAHEVQALEEEEGVEP